MRVIPNLIEINRLLEINNVQINIVNFQIMSGTTDGVVLKLVSAEDRHYVLKFDRPHEIKHTVSVLKEYSSSRLLPKIICVAEDESYFIYTYIDGTTHFNRGSKKNWLATLVQELLNLYTVMEDEQLCGRLGYPRQSWNEFNKTSIEEAKQSIGDHLTAEDYAFVCSQVDKLYSNEPETRYLLHGDTGVHNFVFYQSSIVGVIDPSPMIGPVIYDFIYAFCSSPDDLNLETLFSAFDYLKNGEVSQSRLIDEVSVQLYCRIGISVRHHPNDLPEYLVAWKQWRDICTNIGP